jgi:hypothetical protein
MKAAKHITHAALTQAAAACAPRCSGIFGDVRFSSPSNQIDKTKPNPLAAAASASSPLTPERSPVNSSGDGRKCSGMFNDVQQSAAHERNSKTKPTLTGLTVRQTSAARLLVLGRTGRQVARELDVEEHTITRWRRLPGFAAELARQQNLALALQLTSRSR